MAGSFTTVSPLVAERAADTPAFRFSGGIEGMRFFTTRPKPSQVSASSLPLNLLNISGGRGVTTGWDSWQRVMPLGESGLSYLTIPFVRWCLDTLATDPQQKLNQKQCYGLSHFVWWYFSLCLWEEVLLFKLYSLSDHVSAERAPQASFSPVQWGCELAFTL